MDLVSYAADEKGSVGTVTLTSPANRNALSRALLAQLVEALWTAEEDAAVKVVVVRADGPSFCSGADLKEAGSESMQALLRGLVDVQRQIVGMSKPVVARVQGSVRAGGLGIVAASDIAVGADDCTFALTEVRLGLAAAVISLTVLPRMTSRAAADCFLTGRTFGAEEAVAAGVLTRTVPTAGLDAAVAEVAAELARGSAQGLRETKALLTESVRRQVEEQGDALVARSAELFASPEATQAMQAVLASRSRG